MKEKCTKFEGMFIFSKKEDFETHIEECEDCKIENEKMKNISKLIQKAKPFYFKEQKRKRLQIRTACALFLFVLTGSVFSILNYDNALVETIKYGQTLSAEDFGFPVDSYGLIMVGEWILKKYST